jgi:hypothetical protein
MKKRPSILFDESWEQPPDAVPRVLEVSPDERFLIAQWGQTSGAGRAAIWDVATKKTVFRVPGTRVITWVGDEIVTVATRDRKEYLVWYDRSSYAELGVIPVRVPLGGWLTHAPRIVGDPRSNLAGVVWVDQTEGGLELFRREPTGWTHLPDVGWWQDRCNFVGDAMFSEDGRYLAISVGAPDDWEQSKDRYAGVVVAWDTATLSKHFIDLFATKDPSPQADPIPWIVNFASESSLKVRLQTKEEFEFVIPPSE